VLSRESSERGINRGSDFTGPYLCWSHLAPPPDTCEDGLRTRTEGCLCNSVNRCSGVFGTNARLLVGCMSEIKNQSSQGMTTVLPCGRAGRELVDGFVGFPFWLNRDKRHTDLDGCVEIGFAAQDRERGGVSFFPLFFVGSKLRTESVPFERCRALEECPALGELPG
jgi:hypothetical protein